LLKKPGFTLVVILTLALGIGAVAAILSFVNALLLSELPFREPDGLAHSADQTRAFEPFPTRLPKMTVQGRLRAVREKDNALSAAEEQN
jgi:hypothetical protein